MDKVNENKTNNNKLEIFMSYKNKIYTVLKNKILPKYLKNITIENDLKINEIPEIFNLLNILEEFKINKNNINQIYTNIDKFYNNLDTPFEDLPTYKTLYDIFFIKRNTYDEYLDKPHKEFKPFVNQFISKTGEKKQLNYNRIFKKLPAKREENDIFSK